MSAVKVLNPKAEVARAAQALAINTSAAIGLQDVLRSNLGPKGTMKMYARLARTRASAGSFVFLNCSSLNYNSLLNLVNSVLKSVIPAILMRNFFDTRLI